MSKKDFIALADEMRRLRDSINYNCDTDMIDVNTVINRMADFCKSQNPAFMRDRWLDYIAGKCGKNGGKIAA